MEGLDRYALRGAAANSQGITWEGCLCCGQSAAARSRSTSLLDRCAADPPMRNSSAGKAVRGGTGTHARRVGGTSDAGRVPDGRN